MLVISSREFREHQKTYLDKVDDGIELLIQRGKNRSYKISPVVEDDTLMSKEEFYAKIQLSLQQVKEGKVVTLKTKEDIRNFLSTL